MGLEWKLGRSSGLLDLVSDDGAEYQLYHAKSNAITDSDVYQDLTETLGMAVSKLNESINDSSLYFLIRWESASSTLTISITDDSRKKDSDIVVRCHFLALEPSEAFTENLRFWCKEYLSTDQGFSQFSLVALFADKSRDSAVIL
ncbi:hypothetical protein Misp06_03272 [Microbulbifer sp. NBRC 101763]|uniref:hypothetical protein n=1 Tax=Microbulbifer TaxID=48073 RepID=UPI00036A55F5|nr:MULTISPECIES: hypothetical protein [Microbulbifer]WHI52608.1 hypothetical protein P3339_07525 [Microbulbifer sp. MLAF003]